MRTLLATVVVLTCGFGIGRAYALKSCLGRTAGMSVELESLTVDGEAVTTTFEPWSDDAGVVIPLHLGVGPSFELTAASTPRTVTLSDLRLSEPLVLEIVQ